MPKALKDINPACARLYGDVLVAELGLREILRMIEAHIFARFLGQDRASELRGLGHPSEKWHKGATCVHAS